jgi:5-methylcytosine-specific restriction endonuclease McrA
VKIPPFGAIAMPVKDWNAYPKNWKEISKQIRFERAGGKCEWCGAVNCQPHPITGSKVVLTVAHLGTDFADGSKGDKHNKMDVRPENLAALCQRCHLRYDIDEHIANRKITLAKRRAEKIAAAGQLRLF